MSKYKLLFTFIYILQYSLIHSSTVDPVKNPQKWTPETLYKKLSETYLHKNNPNYQQNLQYMFFDPEYYLYGADIQEANNIMYTLHEKYNVSTHLFFISLMDEKYKTDEAFAAFVDRLSFIIYNNNDNYNENKTLTAVFFIKDRKMRIRTTRGLRKIITDDDALNILNRRKKDLKTFNYEEVINGLMKDIFKTYIRNSENPDGSSGSILFITILFIVGMAVLVYLSNREQPSVQEDKVKIFLDKCKNRASTKEIFSETCTICLDDFKSKEEIESIQHSGNKEYFEKVETSTMECGHKFHRKCISDWLKKEESCPMCRMKFNLKSYENNYNNSKNNLLGNVDFGQILEGILRVQSEFNLLNRREISRIQRIYNPRPAHQQYHNNYHQFNNNYQQYNNNYQQYNNNYQQNNNYRSTSQSETNSETYNESKKKSSPKKNYKSHNSDSGGATAGW